MSSSRLQNAVFMAKYHLWRRDAVSFHRILSHNERLSLDELNEINWRKRKALLSYAYEKVPFYRRKYAAIALHPNDIARQEDYDRIPLLTREELRQNFRDLVSQDARMWQTRTSTTGGSSGTPVKVLFDRRVSQEAFQWRALTWWAVLPGANAAFVWRSIRSGIGALAYRIALWPTRRVFLDASCMTRRAIDEFIMTFNKLRPHLLQGYVGAIYHLALYIEERGLGVHSPKAIWVTSSPLSALQRRRVQGVFNAPVYDQYGCGEVFWLAAQCRAQQGMHMFHDTRFIEFVDADGRNRPPGEKGRIVVTDLENALFPIIRYENGDVGRALGNPCSCGVNLPLMASVTGRTTDHLRLPDGTCIAGDYLTTIFDDFPMATRGFQVVQESDYSIHVRYVPSSDVTELARALSRVKSEILTRTMSQVPVSFEAVDNIPHDRGKLRFIISKIR